MKEEQYINEIVEEVKNVNKGVTNMIIPILKDTISDYKATFRKMFAIIILLIVGLLAVIAYSQYLIAEQTNKFNEFLQQFDFESQTVYQDLDSTDGGNAIVNDGIEIQK